MHLWNIDYPRKAMFASILATLLMLTLLVTILPSATAQSGTTIYAPPLIVTPTIDGVWSSGEWDDAPESAATGPGGTSYLRIKYNSTHVFVLIDSPWDTTNASVYDSENCWVAFDTAHNYGSAPQTDDWLFDNPHSSKQVDAEAWNGTGTDWSAPTFEPNATDYYAEGCTRVPWGGGGIGPQPSPHSSTPHRIDEIMMPLQFAVATPNHAGLYVMVVDDTDPTKYVEWPSGAGGDSYGWPGWGSPSPAPNAWGNLILQTTSNVMYAPPSTVDVTIDGIWSSGEWEEAPQYLMMGNRTGYIRAKFNSTHFLVMIDLPWDTNSSSLYYFENVWLAFDTAHDDGWVAPMSDDYLVHPMNSWGAPAWVGNSSTWDNSTWIWGIAAAEAGENFGWGTPLQPSPNSAIPHRIVEMAVPLAFVGSPGSTVGFYAMAEDDSSDPDGYGWLPATAYSEWPSYSGGSPGWPGFWGWAPCPAAGAWGDLKLSAPVGGTALTVDKLSLLAPYIALVSMIAVAGTAAIYFIRRKKLR